MTADFLIIGSGIAGLSLALKLGNLGTVIIITKKQKTESNTNYAQGGIAAVMGEDDNFEMHINDTLECGAGLCNTEAVRKIVEEGPGMIRELIEIGAKFSREKGVLMLGKEGGHSKNRIIHAKDLTGKEIERALLNKISKSKRIRLFEYYFAIDLLTKKNLKKKLSNDLRCYGIYAFNVKTGQVDKIIAGTTILATGGAGQIYLHTTNPAIATGDGIAMGYRAGCKISNMEFIQFHPTALYDPENDERTGQVFLISEAVRGAGAVLKTLKGKEFMRAYDKRGSLAPRDIVARAIDNEMKKSGDTHVLLDLSKIGIEKIKHEFPNIYKYCLNKGIDITKQMIPVVPAAHYTCGGIKTDLNGKTNVKDLYASGEVTMTGVHGANRLASNSLLEAMVFSNAIYKDISGKMNSKNYSRKNLAETKKNIYDWNDDGMENTEEWILISHNKKEIKEIMSDYIGIVRNTLRLERAYRRIRMMNDEIKDFYDKTKVNVELLELRNLVTVAFLVISSAMKRKESRGLHFMSDFPERDDNNFLKDTVISKSKL
ncbi:MAG TPA: L-aspartate oxidase [Ignavibacteria bacterium]|nr:L-aspartate oxidase [Bacteroidota bacterium]HRI84386.1 L-aspartate oxidase [Ignavibacteria bacterium]HRK00659.1 L-aspartate oxidase [Ignavibacteria bacterium]